MEIVWAFAKGFGTGAGLIIAIGAQNAFVLAQGLLRRFRFSIALLCSVIDAVLIVVGVSGMGLLISGNPTLAAIATWGGIVFLSVYGARAFWAALHPGSLDPDQRGIRSLGSAIGTVLAVSLLNPHVYLDTVVLLGSIASSESATGQVWFGAGAVLASFVWFFSLAYGASYLTPFFKNPQSWRYLDAGIGVVMWAIALSLFSNT